MKQSSLRVLLQRGGAVTVRGLPKALDGNSGNKIRQQLPGSRNLGAWQMIGMRARSTVLELLDVDLMDVLVTAWGKYRVLAEYAQDSDGSIAHEVSLADHTVAVTFHPTVDVTVEGLGRGSLTFDLEVAASIKGICLIIRGGRITAVSSGSCSGSVTLELDGTKLVDQEFPEVDLPGVLDLGEGIPIPRLDAVPAPVAAR
jgi:hypothetical protein